jgi:hypothetical protein
VPNTLIGLNASERFFLVQYGDFDTIAGSELRNADRLHKAILVTAGASMGKAEPITDPFGEEALYPDERVSYSQCSVPSNGGNCAALLATGFRWTSEAARAAKEYRISAPVVEQIRAASRNVHREQVELLQRFLKGNIATSRLEALLAQLEEGVRGRVQWQATTGEGYEIPPEAIVTSPYSESQRLRKLWKFWESTN